MESGVGFFPREMLEAAAMALGLGLIVGGIVLMLLRSQRKSPQPQTGEALDGLSRTLERMEQRLDKIETSVKQQQD